MTKLDSSIAKGFAPIVTAPILVKQVKENSSETNIKSPETKKDGFIASQRRQSFEASYFARKYIAYDPSTGQAIFCETEVEMHEIQAEAANRRKQDLMLATAGDAKSIAAINASIRSQKLQLGLKEEYLSYDDDKAAVLSAARAQAGSLTVAELKLLAAEYPELNAMADEKISQAKARGVTMDLAGNMTIYEINQLAKQKLAAPTFQGA